MKKSIAPTLVMLMAAVLLSGCLAKRKLAASSPDVTVPICQKEFPREFKGVSSENAVDLLRQAESDGCWEPALLSALEAQVTLPASELVKGLKHFNRQQTSGTFDKLTEQYLTSLSDGRIAYGDDERRLLEAYSRHTIRNAHSQESQQLRLVQQVSWRLDRDLYARLFE